MFADVTWVVLHGGGHESGGVAFETVLGSVVVGLVVVGVLWYLGVFHALAGPGGAFASLGAALGGETDAVTEPADEPDGDAADPDAGSGD